MIILIIITTFIRMIKAKRKKEPMLVSIKATVSSGFNIYK